MELTKKEIVNGLGYKSVFYIDKNNYKQGESFIYNPNGTLAEHCFYIDDWKTGEYKSWWEDGKFLSQSATYHLGFHHGVNTLFWENGNISSKQGFHHGHLHGPGQEWNEDGTLTLQVFYHYGKLEGLHYEYYPNGNLKYSYIYKLGLKDSMGSEYDISGNLTFHGIFTNGVLKYKLK